MRLEDQALDELRELTSSYLARIGELGLLTRERDNGADDRAGELTPVAVPLAVDADGESA